MPRSLWVWPVVVDLRMRDKIVSDSGAFRIARRTTGIRAHDRLIACGILVIGFRILEDYVPCVEEARDIAKAAECDIDDGVC